MAHSARLSRDFRFSPSDLRSAVQHALRLTDAQDINWSNGDRNVSARLKMNFWSFGERLQIAISDESRLSALSQCVWPGQIFDWGKNERNLTVFFQHVAEYLGEGRVAPAVRLGTPVIDLGFSCPGCGTGMPPFERSKTTWVSWCVAAILLFVCFPVFWLGFLIRQKEYICSNCGCKIL